jgi:hypothetical protein
MWPKLLALREQPMRAIAACVLILAGWCFGFFSGRMSAWVFPVDPRADRIIAEVQAQAQQALQKPPHEPTVVVAADDAANGSAPPQDQRPLPSALSATEAPPKLRVQDTDEVAERVDSPSGALAEDKSGQPVSAEDGDAAASTECGRRFASFRRSDGTYQPYGSRTRVVCPYLAFRN